MIKHKLLGYTVIALSIIVIATGVLFAIITGKAYETIPLVLFALYQLALGMVYILTKSTKPTLLGMSLNTFALVLVASLFWLFSSPLIYATAIIFLVVVIYQVLISIFWYKKSSRDYIAQHINLMVGAVIIFSSAALLGTDPTNSSEALWWIIPSVVGTPLIVYYKNKYAITRSILW